MPKSYATWPDDSLIAGCPVDQTMATVPADPAAHESRRRQVVVGAYCRAEAPCPLRIPKGLASRNYALRAASIRCSDPDT
jgi:hypothetical protein